MSSRSSVSGVERAQLRCASGGDAAISRACEAGVLAALDQRTDGNSPRTSSTVPSRDSLSTTQTWVPAGM